MTTKQKSMQELWKTSYLSGENDAYIEELYEMYLRNPENVTAEWQKYFNEIADKSFCIGSHFCKN